jgi:hypothetical protein
MAASALLAAAIGCDRRHPSDEDARRCDPLHSGESSNQEPLVALGANRNRCWGFEISDVR